MGRGIHPQLSDGPCSLSPTQVTQDPTGKNKRNLPSLHSYCLISALTTSQGLRPSPLPGKRHSFTFGFGFVWGQDLTTSSSDWPLTHSPPVLASQVVGSQFVLRRTQLRCCIFREERGQMPSGALRAPRGFSTQPFCMRSVAPPSLSVSQELWWPASLQWGELPR